MPYFYLISSVLFTASLSVCAAFFDRSVTDGRDHTPLYNLILLSVAFVLWGIFYGFDFSFEPGVLLFSTGFGICYATGTVGIALSVRYGPVSLTSLMLQTSMACSTIWGFFFWDDTDVTVIAVIGLILVVISLVLCLSGKKDEKKFTAKWFLPGAMAFCGNAGCVIFQKSEQLRYEGRHGSMLMFFSMILSLAVCAVMFVRSEKRDEGKLFRRVWYLPVISSVANVLLNLFVIRLAQTTLSPTVIYPVIAAGGLAVATLASVLIFRERLSRVQWIGVAVGASAIVLLNLG